MSNQNGSQTNLIMVIIVVAAIITVGIAVVFITNTNTASSSGGNNGHNYNPNYTYQTPQPTPTPTFTVTFQDYDGTILKMQNVLQGNSATPPTPPSRAGYAFSGWSKSYTNIQADTLITAQYTKIPTPKFEWDGKLYGGAETTLAGSTYYVYVQVKNTGDAGGYCTIKCQFTQGGTIVSREQTVYIASYDRTTLQFSFPEYSIWNSNNVYTQAWFIQK